MPQLPPSQWQPDPDEPHSARRWGARRPGDDQPRAAAGTVPDTGDDPTPEPGTSRVRLSGRRRAAAAWAAAAVGALLAVWALEGRTDGDAEGDTGQPGDIFVEQ